MEALRNHGPLLEGHSLVFGLMATDLNFPDNIPNAWMAAAPGHLFFIDLLHSIVAAVGAQKDASVEEITGPV
jgi:hypothetical protein